MIVDLYKSGMSLEPQVANMALQNQQLMVGLKI